MMIRSAKASVLLVLGLTAFASAAMVANKVNLTLGGKSLSLDSVQVKGQTYVSLSQLKAQMSAQGGSNQLGATEGAMGEWLFNGVWRFRVTKVEWNQEDEYWVVGIEIRNGSKVTRFPGGDRGMSSNVASAFHLAVESGDSLVITNVSHGTKLMDTIGYKELPAGMGARADLWFSNGKPEDKPTKLVVEFKPYPGFGYVKDPSFRVDLTRSKG